MVVLWSELSEAQKPAEEWEPAVAVVAFVVICFSGFVFFAPETGVKVFAREKAPAIKESRKSYR